MTNKFFPDEQVTENDLYFVCYMIERVARRLHQHNRYVAESLGYDELYRQLSLSSVRHSENPLQVEQDWIDDYNLVQGNFDITHVRKDLDINIPTATQMGKVYKRLILATLLPDEDWVKALLRVYSDKICSIIDDYNTSAYYQPTPVLVSAYNNGGF